MKTIIIITLAVIIGLAILGGGLSTFFSNVGEGTEKIKLNEKLQEVKEQISSKLTQDDVVKSNFDDVFYEECMSKEMDVPNYGKSSDIPIIQEKIEQYKEESCKRMSERPNCLNCGAYFDPNSKSVNEMKTLYDLNNLGQFKEFYWMDTSHKGRVLNYAVQCDTNVKCIDDDIGIDTRIQVVKEMIIRFSNEWCDSQSYHLCE